VAPLGVDAADTVTESIFEFVVAVSSGAEAAFVASLDAVVTAGACPETPIDRSSDRVVSPAVGTPTPDADTVAAALAEIAAGIVLGASDEGRVVSVVAASLLDVVPCGGVMEIVVDAPTAA
jgi:hypothetical protein